MILALSTSSPWISAAVGEGKTLRYGVRREGFRKASELVIATVEEVLGQAGVTLSDLEGIVIDVGPGGFTSVRVGVTVAKMWASVFPMDLYSVSAFDLIVPNGTAAIAGRSDEIVVRSGDALKTLASWPDVTGYGVGKDNPTFPDASRAFEARALWKQVDAATLVPDYIHPPRISKPNTPYGKVVT